MPVIRDDFGHLFAAPGDFIRRVLTLTNLTSVFEVYPTLDAAILAFNGQAAAATAETLIRESSVTRLGIACS